MERFPKPISSCSDSQPAPKPKAPKAPKQQNVKEPEAEPAPAQPDAEQDEEGAEMELDGSPIGGIISTKKNVVKGKEKAEGGAKKPKEKKVLQPIKRKADASDVEMEDPGSGKAKKTKISLTRKDSTKKPVADLASAQAQEVDHWPED